MNEKITELEQLKNSLEMAPCGIGLFDIATGRPIFLNKMYYDFVGYTPEEYQKMHATSMVSRIMSSDQSINALSAEEFRKTGKALNYEYRIICKDGSIMWLKMSASTITLDGKDTAFVSFTDITKEKELEQKAQQEQTRLQLIADEMNAAVFEWSSKDGRFYYSSSYEKYALSQVSADDLLMNRGPKDLIHPEDFLILKKFFEGLNSDQERVQITLRLKMTSGGYRWCKMVGLFYRDETGAPERTVGIIIDVNDEHERSFMLDSMINAMPCGVGIFTFAETMLCEYYSDGFAKIAGISREEMDRKIEDNTVLSSLIAPADFLNIGAVIAERSAKGLPMNLTYRYIYSDGSIRWLHLSATKLREENGYPVYYCVFTSPTEETAQYGDVVENSPAGVYVAEKSTRKTLFVNEAAALMFGFPRGHKLKDRPVEAALKETGRKPLLTWDQINSLKKDEYSQFNVNQDGKYYSVQAKEVLWNGIVSYILYFTDKTNEQTLLASIPGGVAVYRIKKDGRVATDYVSDGLAAMCGYTAEEFLALLKYDACVNLVPEDIPHVMKKMQSALESDTNLSVMYRIYTKQHEPLMIRLDANKMPDTRLGKDDIAAFYAVHTIVSDESKNIINEREHLYNLINAVPTGIGIYEIINGVVQQNYMNDAFYAMLGTTREERLQYIGKRAMSTIYQDDLPKINKAVSELIDGENMKSMVYRLKQSDGSYFWIHFIGSVVERRENYIKIYAACSDYNEIMRAEQNSQYIRKTMEIALQSAGIIAWRYDYKHNRVTDSATLGEAYHLPAVIDNAPQAIIDMGFVAEESQAEFMQLFKKVAEEKPVSLDTKALAPDKSDTIWFRQIYTPVFDKNGKYIDAVGIAMDITDQKQKEQQYEEQQRLNRIAATGALSTVSLNLTRNKVIAFTSSVPELDINREFHTADELLASVNKELMSLEERKKFELVSSSKNMLGTFESGTSHIEIVFHYFHDQRWVKAVYDMLRNPYTSDVEAISSIYDVTDTVRAQKVISQLTDLDYQSLILIDAATGKAVPYQSGHNDANMDALMELQDESDGQLGLMDFMRKYAVPGTFDQAVRENSLDYVKERLSEAPSYSCMHSLLIDGKTEYFRVLYTYLKDDNNLILSAVQNVTEMYVKEMKQKEDLADALSQAEAANKAKTAFLSRVSHDMRTPLNGILGLTRLMKDVSVDAGITHDLTQLELSGKYLLDLINDTLDVSRIESGKLELHSTVCDSRICFNNIQNLIRPGIEEKGINFEMKADNLPFTYLYVDEGRLQQIAMNILGNAIKFTPDGGHIRCLAETLSMKDGIVTDHFVVEDSGCGMSKEFLPHLFEAFSQENAATTNSNHGTGLGMSITKHLVELMNGEIKVTSEPNKGTRFDLILSLPIATKQQVKEWQSITNGHANDYNLHGRRILLCEDHPLNTKIAIRLLEKKEMIVEHAENGKVGVDMFSASEEGYYDAILMDIRMPVLDGIDAARAIRALKRPDAKAIPIIAMTANALDQDVRNTREAGMNAHLSKPIVPEDLYGALEHFINPEQQFIRKRVLIVDDIELNRAAIRAAIDTDYNVYEAESGQQALEILKEHNGMDAVVTDIQMPGMNGDELIRKIREIDNYRHMVIIANTQYEHPGQEEELLSLGANDFIYKPTNPDIVRIRVRNALHAV